MKQFEKMLAFFAQAVSVAFNPLVIPTLGTVIIFRSGNIFSLWPSSVVVWIVFIVSLGTLWLPLVILQLLKHMQYISNMRLDSMKERIFPYTLILITFVSTYLMIQRLNIPSIVTNIVLSSCLAIGVNILFLFYWKISSHAMGVGGLLALVWVLLWRWHSDNVMLMPIAIIIAGLVSWARLWLEAHTEKQVYVGLAIGFLITFSVLMFI
ncbi:MAG TPA: phosphatase PAP2 family protein [Bacteroidales bacterium]|nr:phosphatase PAP2 family protein [Bacteroidales bacterium]HOK98423.1 phosphatase PAP2 family protein [Bacteroidales bacterium]HPO65581.1 phosphatase PAP2 family protein [Bacteroidales bacterium]